MKHIFTALAGITMLLVACSKDNTRNSSVLVNFSYKQTSCSDPWQHGSSDSLTLVNVSSYLASQGLYHQNLSIVKDGVAELCNACFCKTGKTIYVSTLDVDSVKTKFVQAGFVQY